VLIKNADAFNRKMARIIADGIKDLQCVFDFDATVSKAFHNGKLATSCHRALEETLPAETVALMEGINAKYMKIEFDPEMSKADKSPHMVEWWQTAHSKLIQAQISAVKLDEAVQKSGIILREREAEFFAQLQSQKIPILLFSAGITQIVEAAMRFKSVGGLTDNMDVISNKMIFDENGNLAQFSEPLIHTFSKTTAAIGEEWKNRLGQRNNVMLMGDSQGDPDMVKDDETSGTCLRVGFLNHNPEKNRDIYQNMYDIVLVSDETLNVPIELLKLFSSGHAS